MKVVCCNNLAHKNAEFEFKWNGKGVCKCPQCNNQNMHLMRF